VKRALKWLLVAVALLVVAIGIVLFWALRTESGLRFALDKALAATDGKLTIESAEGRLAGPLLLRNVRWRDAGVDARIGRINVDIAPLALLGNVVHLENLEVADVVVETTTQPPAPPSNEPLVLQPPLDIVLDRVLVERIRVSHDGAETFVADRFATVARWKRDSTVSIEKLALHAPQGEVTLDSEFTPLAEYRGKADGHFRWNVDGTDYAGTLAATNDGNLPRVTVQLQLPVAIQAVVGADASNRPLAERDWLFTLKAERFDAQKLVKDSSLKALGFDLSGKVNTKTGEFAGTVDVDDYVVRLDPAKYRLDEGKLVIEALTVTSPDVPGTLNLSGDVPLADGAQAQLALVWKDVLLPAALAGQELASRGNVTLKGSPKQFALAGDVQIGPPGRPADIALAVNGNDERIALERVLLQQHRDGRPAGSLTATGDVTLKPVLGWKLDIKADKLDPGAIAADWPGALNLQLATEGRSEAEGITATLKMPKLEGTLRQRPVTGTADLRIAPGYVVDGTLALASGESTLAVQGRGGKDATDARIGFTLASLGDFLPKAQGRLRGQFDVKGKWPALAVNGRVDGTSLVVDGNRATSFELSTNIADVSAPRGTLELLATGVTAGGQQFDRVSLDGKGDRDSHELTFNARGDTLSAQTQLRGTLKGEDWSGTLNQLTLALKDQPEWTLEQPAALSYTARAITLGELCLSAKGPRICVAGNQAADGSAEGRYRIERLPLAMISALASPDATFALTGEINGDGSVRRSAQGALDGTAKIASAEGRIAYPDRPEQPLLAYTGLAVDATFAPQSQRIVVQGKLSDGGSIDGTIGIAGAERNLSGQIQLGLGSLSFVELFTAEVANTKGKVDGRLAFAGTVAAPVVSGQILVDGFATEVPEAGLKLADGKVQIDLDGQGRVAVGGGISSGKGRLKITGNGGTSADAPLDIVIEGQDFLAADIPAAHIVVSPKLTVRRNEQGLTASGTVDMPKADIDLTKLPGGGAAKTSPDVVVVDADAVESKEALPITADITLKLGDDVKLKGFGLDGKLNGQLVVVERPGRQTTGRGEIRVGGTYKAYGQDLKIQTGRLLFAGTAIDNPGLDLKAVRELKDVTAGLRVQGTAQVPVLTVFSEPALEQSEALSYLITGRPLSALKSGESDLVGAAAQALGSATGDLLAKSIGARLGVDAAVADNTALGGAALTVGKYLSPKLYLSYGVGIFTPGEVITLRYKLSRLWELEAQNATTENRAGLNYRLEK
jgi:translocation and assembly module TamB